MANLNADTVLAQLEAYAHDWVPAKIALRNSLANDRCLIYQGDARTPIYVSAAHVDRYLGKSGSGYFRTPNGDYYATPTVTPATLADAATLDTATVWTALQALTDGSPDKVALKARLAGKTCLVYDPYWSPVYVQADRLEAYMAKTGFRFASELPTIAMTGTAISGGVVESEIVTGSQTVILTVTNGEWPASGAAFNAIRQSIIDGMVSAQAEAHGWNVDIKAAAAVTTVARTSATVLTFTTPAAAAYSITANETITVTVPAGVITADGTAFPRALAVSPASFDITHGS